MTQAYAPCEVNLEIGDGEHLCKLTLKTIAELQEKCDAGIGVIYMRVMKHEFTAVDVTETVRLGLIGGGMSGTDARKLMDRYLDKWPLEVWHKHAIAILAACMHGYEPPTSRGKDQEVVGQATQSSTSEPPTGSDTRKA